MTDDEVTVLFCFMCSDYGPPDFTNTEWLDMFNKIREEVYDKENPITSAEAQHTLNRLKLREYLWADQARGNLTEDAQDWIVYRISRGVSGTGILFDLSSLITAQRYLRSRRYNKKKGENCVSSDESYFDDILIRRLQMNILTHVTMEDTEICDKVSQILNVPVRILKESEEERTQIQKELKQTGEKIKRRKESHNDHKQNLTWLWRNMANARLDIVRSCIGSYPHLDIYIIDNIAYRKPSTYHIYPPDIRSLLYSLLLVESYSLDVNDQTHNKVIAELRKKYFTEVHFSEEKKITDIPKGIIDINGSIVKFISEDIRHDVMYAFVTECLVEDSDLEFFLTMASRDVISEYCRSWDYQRSDGERCLFVPDIPGGMYDLFIDKLQLDIISHCTVSDWGIHGSISRHLNIPQEILRWNIDARERFVKNSMLGSEKMFRARGMIVGCAGAGKTTLLRKLHGRERTDDNKPTETTVGLEVHEDLFAVENNILIDFCMEKAENPYLENKVISMTDFAGQVAYYACHQVYLSRRAFYIVVIDMSRKLTEVCRLFDTDRHNPTGSLFHSWTYKGADPGIEVRGEPDSGRGSGAAIGSRAKP
ncbi:uncharacterized protein LOC134276921 [Saccostrea cucullata]|uniref:uncharacterized protein LOC134276921 n=1 Tax=Saccostrea cuccullata TaxID=36930 RepID=UPI002ED26F8A